ncbi:two-component system sensor histidine kinase DesK [Streptomyces sp. 3330]|uniref:sensor histidine kinase n=1 Tax=Streptomyces sp. 3330 TaxID=2817755 RepID=UPI00285E0875|nr:histidine kinase [Streptomyces sp. 3330]MDR6973533.1 two-component system sensor histidine kinase DesK [Streptomyces sp. 3330]
MTRSFEDRRRAADGRRDAWRSAFRTASERRRHGRAEKERCKAEYRGARPAGQVPEDPGPPASGFSLLPWLLMGMGAFSNLFQGEADPWIGGLGLLTFNSLYIYVAFRAFVKQTRDATSTRVALALLGLVTCGLALGYGGSWLLFLPLFGLATGAVLRGPQLRSIGTGVAVLAGAVACARDGWEGLTIAYATWISTMVTAAILSLSEAVRELRAAREELARRAVEEERLRFSRDLHDLLGHTLSVIVVKSEAARRLAPRDMEAALSQVTDIEAVGRQALTEIREAVTGYRESSLAGELDRARSALTAAGVEPSVSRSGPPPDAKTSALLGWVVREAVTNVVRHSDASHCGITVSGTPERVRLTVTDDGGDRRDGDGGGDHHACGDGGCAPGGGTGLTGLRERLAAAGGTLTAGPGPHGGFTVTAELPLELPMSRPDASPDTLTGTRTDSGTTAGTTTGTAPTAGTATGAGTPVRTTTGSDAEATAGTRTDSDSDSDTGTGTGTGTGEPHRTRAPAAAPQSATAAHPADTVPSVAVGPNLGP